jgi:hypothetical protein
MRAATIAAILFIGATAAGASSTYRRGLHTAPYHGRAISSSSRGNVYSLGRPGAPKPPKPKPAPH